jgi:hypothetical protein
MLEAWHTSLESFKLPPWTKVLKVMGKYFAETVDTPARNPSSILCGKDGTESLSFLVCVLVSNSISTISLSVVRNNKPQQFLSPAAWVNVGWWFFGKLYWLGIYLRLRRGKKEDTVVTPLGDSTFTSFGGLVPKNTAIILIAFLSGLLVAGGSAYMVTSVRNKPATVSAQPAASSTVSTITADPVATPPTASEAINTGGAQQDAQSSGTVSAETKPKARHKPNPGVEQQPEVRQAAVRARRSDEASAYKPTQVAQVAEPATPAPAEQLSAPSQPASSPQPASPVSQGATNDNLYPPPGTQTAPPLPRQPQTVTLAAGTSITVRVNETLSTNTNYPGDTFTASLANQIVVNGFVIADRGSRVIGKVVRAEKAGRVKGTAELALTLTEIHTTDGQTVRIETAPWDQQGPTSKKRDAAEMAGGAALGAIIGAIAGGGRGAAIGAGAGGAAGTGAVLTTRGKAAEVPAETRLTFTLSNNVSLTERLN